MVWRTAPQRPFWTSQSNFSGVFCTGEELQSFRPISGQLSYSWEHVSGDWVVSCTKRVLAFTWDPLPDPSASGARAQYGSCLSLGKS